MDGKRKGERARKETQISSSTESSRFQPVETTSSSGAALEQLWSCPCWGLNSSHGTKWCNRKHDEMNVGSKIFPKCGFQMFCEEEMHQYNFTKEEMTECRTRAGRTVTGNEGGGEFLLKRLNVALYKHTHKHTHSVSLGCLKSHQQWRHLF